MTRANLVMWGVVGSIATTVALGFFFVQRDARRDEPSDPEPDKTAAQEAEVGRLQRQLELRQLARLPAQPATPPLELGPASGSLADREQAVLALLQGRVEAWRLPVVATEHGAPYDPRLRNALAPMRYKSSLRPPSKCTCPAGDPLCSCL